MDTALELFRRLYERRMLIRLIGVKLDGLIGMLPDGLPDAATHTWPRQMPEGFLPSLGSLPEPDHIQAWLFFSLLCTLAIVLFLLFSGA